MIDKEIGKDLFILFSLLFVSYNANLRLIPSGDTMPARLLPFSILREGNLDLDEFNLGVHTEQGNFSNLPDFVREIKGHMISVYPVTTPMLITPLYLPVVWFRRAPVSLESPVGIIMEKLSASFIASLSALFVYLSLRELCARRPALWLTLLYAFGTNTWVTSSQTLWQHGVGELALSLMCYALLKSQTDDSWLRLAGLGAGLAAAARPTNVIFSLLSLIYVWRFHRREVVSFLLWPVIIGIPLVSYNLFYFGTITGGYGTIDLTSSMLLGNFLRFDYEGLLGILFSPSRGLFIYTPFVFFSVWGGILLWRDRTFPPVLKYMSLGVVGQVFLYGKYSVWWGGWSYGPRFLTDIVPFLCLMLVPILPLLRQWMIRSAFIVACLFSIAVQIIGVFCYNYGWDIIPVNVDFRPQRLWDWHDPQILRTLQDGLAPTWPILKGNPTPLTEFAQQLSVSADLQTMRTNEIKTLPVTVKNIGKEVWRASGNYSGSATKEVRFSYHWLDKERGLFLVLHDGIRTRLPHDVAPGETVLLQAKIKAPAQEGSFVLRLTMVQEMIAWFEDRGAQPLDLSVMIQAQ